MKKTGVCVCLMVILAMIGFASCEEDHDTGKNEEIYGNWKINLFMTDNEGLNKVLPTLLPLAGVDLSEATILFDKESSVKISIPATGGSIEKETRYNFDGRQLAITLEDIGGIPVNAFEVPSYTAQEMTLVRVISPLELKVMMALLKEKNETLSTMLESLLGDSLDKGLTLTIKIEKTGGIQ